MTDTTIDSFPSDPFFKLPRIPAGKIVSVHLRWGEKKDWHQFEGLFETSGLEKIGTKSERYILRRIAGPLSPAEFLNVPRYWQESGHIHVHSMDVDPRFLPAPAQPDPLATETAAVCAT